MCFTFYFLERERERARVLLFTSWKGSERVRESARETASKHLPFAGSLPSTPAISTRVSPHVGDGALRT